MAFNSSPEQNTNKGKSKQKHSKHKIVSERFTPHLHTVMRKNIQGHLELSWTFCFFQKLDVSKINVRYILSSGKTNDSRSGSFAMHIFKQLIGHFLKPFCRYLVHMVKSVKSKCSPVILHSSVDLPTWLFFRKGLTYLHFLFLDTLSGTLQDSMLRFLWEIYSNWKGQIL